MVLRTDGGLPAHVEPALQPISAGRSRPVHPSARRSSCRASAALWPPVGVHLIDQQPWCVRWHSCGRAGAPQADGHSPRLSLCLRTAWRPQADTGRPGGSSSASPCLWPLPVVSLPPLRTAAACLFTHSLPVPVVRRGTLTWRIMDSSTRVRKRCQSVERERALLVARQLLRASCLRMHTPPLAMPVEVHRLRPIGKPIFDYFL